MPLFCVRLVLLYLPLSSPFCIQGHVDARLIALVEGAKCHQMLHRFLPLYHLFCTVLMQILVQLSYMSQSLHID